MKGKQYTQVAPLKTYNNRWACYRQFTCSKKKKTFVPNHWIDRREL